MQFPPTPGRADTGKLHLAFTTKAGYDAKAASLHWGTWAAGECGTNAKQFYVGTFTRDKDSGPVVGCISQGPSGLFYGVFGSTVYKVEGGLAGSLGGVMTAGIFPAQPQDEFNTSFIGHFAGDGAVEEEQQVDCSGDRVVADAAPPRAACKVSRVGFKKDTNLTVASTDTHVWTGETIYFRGVVKSTVLPALVALVFPPQVDPKKIFVLLSASSGIGPCGDAKTNAKDGTQFVLCKLTVKAPTPGIVVFGVDKLLAGVDEKQVPKELKVELRVGPTPKPGQSAPDWLAARTTEVSVSVTPTDTGSTTGATASPAPPPPPKNPLAGEWKAAKWLPGTTKADGADGKQFPQAFPQVDVVFVIVAGQPGKREGLLAESRAAPQAKDPNQPQIYLDNPAGNLYDAVVHGPGNSTSGTPVHFVFIPAGQFAPDDYSANCSGIAIQAKADVLCGVYGTQRIVLAKQ